MNEIPTPTPERSFLDIPYNPTSQRLDIFQPPDLKDSMAAVVWVHGGGWAQEDKNAGAWNNTFYPAKWLTQKGYIAVTIDYRLTNEAVFPAQIEDCEAAIRWLRAHAEQFHIDSNRIGVWGESAGGHLAALLGTMPKNPNQPSAVRCVVDMYGPTDLLHYGDAPTLKGDGEKSPIRTLLGGGVLEKRELALQASPLYSVSKSAAPFLILHGDADGTVPLDQSLWLSKVLGHAGVECELHVVAGLDHDDQRFNTPGVLSLIETFLERHLRFPDPSINAIP